MLDSPDSAGARPPVRLRRRRARQRQRRPGRGRRAPAFPPTASTRRSMPTSPGCVANAARQAHLGDDIAPTFAGTFGARADNLDPFIAIAGLAIPGAATGTKLELDGHLVGVRRTARRSPGRTARSARRGQRRRHARAGRRRAAGASAAISMSTRSISTGSCRSASALRRCRPAIRRRRGRSAPFGAPDLRPGQRQARGRGRSSRRRRSRRHRRHVRRWRSSRSASTST